MSVRGGLFRKASRGSENMSKLDILEAWHQPLHADFFDARARYRIPELRRDYEQFNEFGLFLEQKGTLRGRCFVEVACATGELYRYLRRYHPEFRYTGFDISDPAIERARRKFPDGRFEVCKPDLSEIISSDLIKPSLVWARDVIHHQPNPFEYLSRLVTLSSEATILRLRTRDRGDTVVDPELSCQLQYNHWVPYIVLNMHEIIETICRAVAVRKMIIIKSYETLGGWNERFLPKECYYAETGTAETAIWVLRSENGDYGNPEIIIRNRQDSHRGPVLIRMKNYLRKKLSACWGR